MSLKFQTNEVLFKIDYDELCVNYKLFELNSSVDKKGYYALFTALKENKQIVEMCDAICYIDNGQHCFAMSQKSIVRECNSAGISCTTRNFKDVSPCIVLKLILIAQKNVANENINSFPLTNIDGKLFYYLKHEKDQIITLELDFIEKDDKILFQNNLVTFTKLSSFYNKEELLHKPKYELANGCFLQRTDDTENGYIRKKIKHSPKNSILEFAFEPQKIKSTRIFSTACIYKILRESNYVINFSFVGKEFDCLGKEYYERQSSKICTPTIKIVNKTNISHLTEKLQNALAKLGIQSEAVNDVCDWSIIIIDDKEKTSDIQHHFPNMIKQCIVKDNVLNLTKNKKPEKQIEQDIPDATLLNILNQLQIKSDILNNNITTFNFNYISKDFSEFTMYAFDVETEEDEEKNKKNKETYCSSIKFDNAGNILKKDVNIPIGELDLQLFTKYKNNIGINKSGYFIVIDDSWFCIKETGLHTIPNINKIYHRIFKDKFDAVHKKQFFYDHLTTLYNKRKNGKNTEGKKTKAFLIDYENMINDGIFKNLDVSLASSEMMLQLSDYKSCYEEILDLLYRRGDYFGIPFKRITETLDDFFACYTHSGYTVENNKLFYFSIQLPPHLRPDRTVQNASLIREIIPMNNAMLTEGITKILLDMICVSFVRYGSYSTLPFPAKYIRELRNSDKEII